MERSLSTGNSREIRGCEAADCLELRMKESAGISARTVLEFAEIEAAGEVYEAILFSCMYAPIVLLGFACVAFVGKKRGDKFQCADA